MSDEHLKIKNEACPKCGRLKEMYYGLWCPFCDKPEVLPRKVLNLVQALEYIEANGNPDYKERVWNGISDLITSNDCYIQILWEEDGDLDPDFPAEDLKLLAKVFEIDFNDTLFEVSW
jgi:hypothetical protein